MKIYKCDICGKTVRRPSEMLYCCSEGLTDPNKLEMMTVAEDGDICTKLSFDLCEDCSKYICNCLKGLKKKKRPNLITKGSTMNLQISQMREKIREVYSGDSWAKRVRNMPNDQVIAIYYKLLKNGKIKDV